MRDFFYNKGDVFIAVLIILIAAAVIYMRVGVIMEYSASGGKDGGWFQLPSALIEIKEKLSGKPAEVTGVQEGADSAAAGTPVQTETPKEAPKEAPVETPPALPEDEPGPAETTPATPATPTTPTTPATIQITIEAGDAASTVADKLFAAGAITDKQAFLAEVMAQGADSKLKIGTFVIPAGSSHADIIKILVG